MTIPLGRPTTFEATAQATRWRVPDLMLGTVTVDDLDDAFAVAHARLRAWRAAHVNISERYATAVQLVPAEVLQ